MRTRSNDYFGQGAEGAVKYLLGLYPAGKVKVVTDDEDEGAWWCELLTDRGYIAEAVLYERLCPDEDFCFGIGSEDVLLATKRNAKNKYAFYPTVLLPDLFTENERGLFSEFSYFDTDFFTCDNEKTVAECYAGLFCALTEGLAKIYAEKGRPFSDKSLYSLCSRAKSVLLGKSDREQFLTECVLLTKGIAEVLSARGVKKFFPTDMGRALGGGVKNRNLSSYFLNRLLILFTKWNFRDMLIATESATKFSTNYGVNDLVLSDTDLSDIAVLIKNDVAKPNLSALVAAMKSTVFDKNDLFCEIFSRGLPEGLVEYG